MSAPPKYPPPPWEVPATVRALLAEEMMGKPRPVGVGATCVVRAEDVERLSQNGWVFVMVVHSSRVDRPHGTAGGQCACRACTEATSVVDTPLFVMVRGHAGELDKARAEARKWEEERNNAARDWREAESKLRTAEKARDDMRDERDSAVVHLGIAKNASKARDAQFARIETDLARVRREVGEKEWKRITGGEP